jgi:hypothetical protein
VVRELEVLTTRVDVHLGANDAAGHRTALNVPTCRLFDTKGKDKGRLG